MLAVGVLETSRGTLCKVYDCLITKLYTQNQYTTIILNAKKVYPTKMRVMSTKKHVIMSAIKRKVLVLAGVSQWTECGL